MTLVVAIAEGADFDLLKSDRGRGHCPWFTQVLASETWWRLECGPAPYEPSNLATAFTGKGRGYHGCYSYWSIRSHDSGPPRVLSSDDLQVPWLWNWPELRHLRFAVTNVQLTHPPKPLNGTLLSYLMNQTLRYTYPADFVHEMKRRGLPYGHDVSVFYRGEPAETYFQRVLQVARYQLETALAIGREHDVLIVNLTIVDRLSHFLWSEMESGAGAHNPAVLRGYEFLDEALTALDGLAAPDPILVISEIGFGPLDRFESLDHVLADGGFLQTTSDGEIDASRTRAREAVQGSHGIVLLSGGEGGTLCNEVMSCLLEGRTRDDGQPIVAAAMRREEIYEGLAVSLAPDIVVVPADPRRPPAGDLRWARHVNRHLQTGWHRDLGFAAVRRARPLAPRDRHVRLESIAPTVALLAGGEPPAWCTQPLASR